MRLKKIRNMKTQTVLQVSLCAEGKRFLTVGMYQDAGHQKGKLLFSQISCTCKHENFFLFSCNYIICRVVVCMVAYSGHIRIKYNLLFSQRKSLALFPQVTITCDCFLKQKKFCCCLKQKKIFGFVFKGKNISVVVSASRNTFSFCFFSLCFHK